MKISILYIFKSTSRFKDKYFVCINLRGKGKEKSKCMFINYTFHLQ